MLLLQLLKLILSCWLLLLLLQSIMNDFPSLILISGSIITSMPFTLLLALLAGIPVFRAVLLFSLFILAVIILHITQLALG